jgi:hypothetical protein
MWWRGCCSSLFSLLMFLSWGGLKAGEPGSLVVACDQEAGTLLLEDPAAARVRLKTLNKENPSPICTAALGAAYFLEGNDFWAIRTLQRAAGLLAASPGSPEAAREVEWLLCLALARTEQWEDAAGYCASREADGQSVRGMLDYYGGVAAFKTGDDVAAVRRLARPVPSSLDPSARRFLELSIGRLAGLRPGLELSLGSSVAFDSNALMVPEDPAVVGIVGDVEAFKNVDWLQFGYRFRNVGRYLLALRAEGSRSFHFAELPKSVNATDLGASATVQRYAVVGQGKIAWEARYGYRATFLDGGEATLRDDFFGFVEAHSLSLGPSIWSASGHGLSIRYSVSNQRFAELVRNGFAHSLSIGEEFALADNLRLAVAQSGTFAISGQPYTRWGASFGTFLIWQPAAPWTVMVRGTGLYEDYFNSAGYFDANSRRADWSYVARLELGRALGLGFSAGLFGGAAGRHSSISPLTYDKLEAGAQLTWNYGAL